MTNIVRADSQPIRRSSLADKARRYLVNARSDNTRRAYACDLGEFQAFCQANRVPHLPASPETVGAYIVALADSGRKLSTIKRRLAAISQNHQGQGHEPPTRHTLVRELLKGIRRTHGDASNSKEALLIEDLRRVLVALPASIHGVRDRALLLIGFAGGFRRSELVGLDLADVAFTRDGLIVTLRRSKTDQGGAGRQVAIPYGSTPLTCPVRALEDWLRATGIAGGPIFRAVTRQGRVRQPMSAQSVALVVKKAVRRIGLDPDQFGGHSLRAGLCTAAARAGVSEQSIMNQTGHRSSATLRRYIRRGELFVDNAAARLGL